MKASSVIAYIIYYMHIYLFTFQHDCKGEEIDLVAWSKSLNLDKEKRKLGVSRKIKHETMTTKDEETFGNLQRETKNEKKKEVDESDFKYVK